MFSHTSHTSHSVAALGLAAIVTFGLLGSINLLAGQPAHAEQMAAAPAHPTPAAAHV